MVNCRCLMKARMTLKMRFEDSYCQIIRQPCTIHSVLNLLVPTLIN